jgi:AcrR family transcriptional regulator
VNAPVASEKITSTRRILDAARALVASGGAAAVSIGDVAQAAHVSKALVHYHFRDKETLLAELARLVGADVLTREAAMLDKAVNRPLDDYWDWLLRELELGDVRVLMSLAPGASDPVARELEAIAVRRRELATRHAAGIFDQLGLHARVAPQLLGDTMVALVDGLAASAALEPQRDARPVFDVLWLALLSLAE